MQELGVTTPFFDEVIEWARSIRGKKFFNDGEYDQESILCLAATQQTYCTILYYIVPPTYGINNVKHVLD